MKKNENPSEFVIINKENFHLEYENFKKELNNKLLEYIFLNIDISTNLKEKFRQQELIFTEITLVKRIKTNNDINFKIKTFLIPSLKFHKFAQEEYVSFNPELMKYLFKYKNVYDINTISNKNTISYDNMSNKENFIKFFEKIIEKGKPPKKENKKSYIYFPKALTLHSKTFQIRFEEIVKNLVQKILKEIKNNNNLDNKNKKNENEDNIQFFDSNVYENNYKLIKEILNTNLSSIFQPFFNEMIEIKINKIKIEIKENKNNLFINIIDFYIKLLNFIENDKEEFIIENDLIKNKEFYNNVKEFLLSEKISFVDLIYDENDLLKKINICRSKEFNNENLKKILNEIKNLKEKNEIDINDINYYNFDFRKLFYLKENNEIIKNLIISYHFQLMLNFSKIPVEITKKSDDFYFDKIKYNKFLLNTENQHEIIFGYNFETEVHKFLNEIQQIIKKNIENNNNENNNNNEKTINLNFGKDLDLFLKNEKFEKIFKENFKKFSLKLYENKEYYIFQFPNEIKFNLEDLKKEIVDLAETIKKENNILEELGVSIFLNELFNYDQKFKIFGCNIKKKIEFIIKNNIINYDENKNNLEDYFDKFDLYDLIYISKKLNFNFYKKYLEIGRQKIGLVTQKIFNTFFDLIYNNNELKNKILKEYKNCFINDYENDNYNLKNENVFNKEDFDKNNKCNEIIENYQKKNDFFVEVKRDNNNIIKYIFHLIEEKK